MELPAMFSLSPDKLTSWWLLNQPILKNMLVKLGSSSPRFGVNIKKNETTT